jgi:hypothetical protein
VISLFGETKACQGFSASEFVQVLYILNPS